MSPPFQKSFDEHDSLNNLLKMDESLIGDDGLTGKERTVYSDGEPSGPVAIEGEAGTEKDSNGSGENAVVSEPLEINSQGKEKLTSPKLTDEETYFDKSLGKVMKVRVVPQTGSASSASAVSTGSETDEMVEYDSDSDGNLVRYDRQFRRDNRGPLLRMNARRKKAPKQVEHVAQYAKLVEDRIVVLEDKVRQLRRGNKNSQASHKRKPLIRIKESVSPPRGRPPLPRPARRYSSGSDGSSRSTRSSVITVTDDELRFEDNDDDDDDTDFDKWVKVKRVSLKDYIEPKYTLNHVIDVAMGTEQQLRKPLPSEKHVRTFATEEIAPSWSPENTAPGMPAEFPIRLRINSKMLCVELQTAIDVSIRNSTTILRPFKVLLTNETQIRKHMVVLEEELKELSLKRQSEITEHSEGTGISAKEPEGIVEPSETAARSQESPNEQVTKYQISQVRRRTKAWRCLVELLDVDLRGIRCLREEIKKGERKTIQFLDAWQLYEPGDLVFKKTKGKTRAMRVLDVTGGRSLITTIPTPPPPGPPRPPNAGPSPGLEGDPRYRATSYDAQISQPLSDLHLSLFYLGFDGAAFGAIQEEVQISVFDGERDITSLEVLPEQYLPNLDQTKRDLKQRGIKYRDLLSIDTGAHRQYTGLTWNHPQEEIDSFIVVDWGSCLLYQTEWERILGLKKRFIPDNREIRETDLVNCGRPNCRTCYKFDIYRDIYGDHNYERKLTRQVIESESVLRKPTFEGDQIPDDDLILLDFVVYGWILRDRRWAQFDIDLIRTIPQNKDGFKSLSLPEGYQEIVESLVTTHFKKKAEEKNEQLNVDLVQGKGKGLIILLHGAPGTGKTSTAECVAEYTSRPLYPITCGDIGETAREVEKSLQETFQLAHKWGCVLLLDEADVFLAKRDKTDVKRNALVSVFLRVLEYYAGILFLTTNRVGTMDEAFRSRIHMSLHYPPLSAKFTREVWRTNLRRMKDGPPAVREMVYNEKEILKFAKKHFEKSKEKWNGRQIRNAFQTAIALAFWDKAKGDNHESGSGELLKEKPAILTRRHFEKVAETSKAFNEYMIDVNARGALEQAHVEGWRADPNEKFEDPNRKSKSKKHSSDSDSYSDAKHKKKTSKHKDDANKDEWDSSSSSDSDRKQKKGKSRKKHESDDDSGHEHKKKSKARKKDDSDEEDEDKERKGKKDKSKRREDSDDGKKERRSKKEKSKKKDEAEDSDS